MLFANPAIFVPGTERVNEKDTTYSSFINNLFQNFWVLSRHLSHRFNVNLSLNTLVSKNLNKKTPKNFEIHVIH